MANCTSHQNSTSPSVKGLGKTSGSGYSQSNPYGGKGKGYQGQSGDRQCYNCGIHGHPAKDCRKPWNGKGGKGGIRGVGISPEDLLPGSQQGAYHAPHWEPATNQDQQWAEQQQGMNLGRPISSISKAENDESDGWKVKTSRARSKHDMRASKIVYPKEYLPPPPGISSIDFQQQRCLDQVKGVEGGWQRISATLDSAAIETVGPPEIGNCFPLTETTASKNGINYSAANGSAIKNYGQRILHGGDNNWKRTIMPMQVAQVKKVLVSAAQVCMAGNRCMLDTEEGSWIEDKRTGEITQVEYSDGEFKFDLWIPAKGPSINAVPKESETVPNVSTQNQFQAFSEGEVLKSGSAAGFTWQEWLAP